MEYVNVANIIEQERKKRQAQIFKGVDTNIIDHIEKAHEAEFQKGYTEGYTEELPENLQRFSSDIESFNKAETEFLLSKIQGELNANFDNPLLKSMKTIALNHLNTEIEKARSGVYADTAENRKLGRVGQQYGESKNTFKPGHSVKAILPTGKAVEGVYVEPYGTDSHMIKVNGKLYGVKTQNLEKIAGQYAGKRSRATRERMADKLDELAEKSSSLKRQRKQVERDMEEELGALGESAFNDGNNPVVVQYSKQLDKLDKEIAKVEKQYKAQKDRYYHE